MAFKPNFIGPPFDLVGTGGGSIPSGSMVYKGNIGANSDFPTSAEVQVGWLYYTTAPVTDDDATKTNTGQDFSQGVNIMWDGVGWLDFGSLGDYVPYSGAVGGLDMGTWGVTGGAITADDGAGHTTEMDGQEITGSPTIIMEKSEQNTPVIKVLNTATVALTGTVDWVGATSPSQNHELYGTGTKWLTDLQVADTITIDGHTTVVSAIYTDEYLRMNDDPPWFADKTGLTLSSEIVNTFKLDSDGKVDSNLSPKTTDTKLLGTPDLKWSNTHTTKINDNPVTEFETAYTHSQLTSGNPHDVSWDELEAGVVDYIDFNTTWTGTHQEGRVHWDDDSGTLELGMPGGNVNLQVGQETIMRVRNTSGSTIDNGKAVYVTGATGNKPEIALASASNHIQSMATIAVTTESIANNQFGYVTTNGIVRDLDTSFVAADGAPAFLSTVAGGLSASLPTQPDSQVFIGVVLRKHASEGMLYVKIIAQPNLEELSDLSISGIADKDLLQWNNSNSTWDNTTLNDTGLVSQVDWNQNGFENQTDSTISFTDGTLTFSIQPTSTNFDYWVGGVKYTSTGDTKVITDTEGIWVFYYDSDGDIQAVNNPNGGQIDTVIRTCAIISIVYWDATNNEAIYVGEERHGKDMSPSTHAYLHFTEGLRYLSGLGLNTMDVDEDGDDNEHAQFGIDAGGVTDEDLYSSISAVASTTGLPIYYMLGSTPRWVKDDANGFACRTYDKTTADRLAFNEFTGGAWQLTEESNGDFVLYHVFATTEKDTPMISIMGQNGYATKNAAREGAETEIKSLVLNDIMFPEIRPIATIIYQTKLAYGNDVNARIVSTDEGDDYVDWRNESVSRAEISTSDHGSLTGLGSDDHPQYRLKCPKIIVVDADGCGDYTSIQTALDDNPTANTLFLVSPGTYTDTIHFTANNQSVKAIGNCPTQTEVTQANNTVVDFGTFTSCRVIEFKLTLTAPSSYVNLVSGAATGGFSGKLYRCYGSVSGNTYTTFCPQIFGHPTNPYTAFTTPATLELIRGTYTITDTTTNALKSIVWVPVNLTLNAEDAQLYGYFTNGGVFCPGVYGSGTVNMSKSKVVNTGTNLSGDIMGALLQGSTNSTLNQNYFEAIGSGTTANAYGLSLSGASTITITSNYNTYKGGGAATNNRGLNNFGANITINSSMDAIIGSSGIFNIGTLNMVGVDGTGNWRVDGDIILSGDLTDGTNSADVEELKLHSWDIPILNPNAAYDNDTQIPVSFTDAAITIKRIVVSNDSASYNVAGDLKWADNLTSFTGATVINDFDTTSGVRDDSSITSASVASGKYVYLQFDSQPSSSLKFTHIHVEWEYS